MGEALISRGTAGGGGGGALVKVTTFSGATVTCTSNEKSFTKTSTGDPVEFTLGYGSWDITAVTSSKTYSTKLNVDTLKVYDITLLGNMTLGISIDMSNSAPADAVTYTDDAVGYTPLAVDLSTGVCNYGSWETIINHVIGCKPCLYKDGARVAYLDPNDYSKFEDGSDADISSGEAGDVMVEFKKVWYKYAVDGTTLTFQIANYDRSADGFINSAFKSMDGNATIKDYMYFGAYEGLQKDGKTRSLSGVEAWGLNPNPDSYTAIRDTCKANGESYGMEDWCKRYYILGLLMLVTKTRGIQAAIGAGCTKDNEMYDVVTVGSLDQAGLFAGYEATEFKGVKAFGIENLWGNYYSWCDGIITLSSTTLGFKDCPPYNDTGDGYTSIADGYPRGSGKYPTSMVPVMDGAGITASVGQADATLGWCDYFYVYSSTGRVALVGGGYDYSATATGPFFAFVVYTPTLNGGDCVGRLVSA